MSRRVLEVRPKLCYYEDFLVACVYYWILCSAGGFSQNTTLYPWQRQILVGMLMSRWSIFNYALHSQGGSYSSFPLQLGPQKGEFSHLVASLASQDSKQTTVKTPSSHYLLQYELFLGPSIVG